MTVSEFITTTYLFATGKVTPPSAGTTKYNKLLALGNIFLQNWASESGVDWKSLRTIFTFGATVSATDTYALPTTIGKLSKTEGDFVRITHTDGTTESDYTIIPIERLYDDERKLNNSGGDYCAVSGSNLIFKAPFTADSAQFGGTITIPGYAIPATLTTGTDVIQVDDPYWLCFMSAAEYIRTDLTRQAQYSNLVAQANNVMEGMKSDNNTQRESAITNWSPGGGLGGPTWS